MSRQRCILYLLVIASSFEAGNAISQEVQFPRSYRDGYGSYGAAPYTGSFSRFGEGYGPYGDSSGISPGGSRLGAPTLEPYSSGAGGAFGGNPFNPAPPVGASNPNFGTPSYGPGYGTPYGGLNGAPSFSAPPPNGAYAGAASSPYGQQGGYLFPNGAFDSSTFGNGPVVNALRVLQQPRFSDTYIYGTNRDTDLSIHDLDFAITGAVPNFLFTNQPLYITPTFIFHLWDGPQFRPADLPSKAYSAFLDAYWQSDTSRPIGAEVGASVGIYSDFQTLNSRSLRVRGEGFGVFRLTPALTAKVGVWYLNRNDLKLLPAGGLVWQPNPQTRFDILFPNPKFSQFLSTFGNADVWWYVAGEYGGGAWTIQRTDGSSDLVDINDYRVKLGLEWVSIRSWRGFAEVGYVFHRDIVYVVDPTDSFRARSTILFGAGLAF